MITPPPLAQLAGAIDPARRHGSMAIGLRDRAIVALLEAGVLAVEIPVLRVGHVRVRDGAGGLEIVVQRGRWECAQLLSRDRSLYLLEWLEAERLWGRDAPLFPGRSGAPISARTVSVLLLRYRSRAGCPRPRRRPA